MNEMIEEIRNAILDIESLKAKKDAIKKLALEHRDTVTDVAEVEKQKAKVEEINKKIEEREQNLKTLQSQGKQKEEMKQKMEIEKNEIETKEKRSSMEYRKAFMNYIQRGVKSNELEFRVNQYTSTSDAATVIPSTIMDEIIKESKVSGNILSKVRKMNVKGGVKFSTLTAIPTATWIDEATTSDRKKLTTGSVTFTYYGLEVKIAQSLLSEYVSIDAFEREFAVLAVEAMTNAKEIAIFNGNGTSQPEGIFTNASVTSHTITAANFVKYDKLVEAIGKLKVSYRSGAELAMAAGTWDAIQGMVDTNGQPVARINYGLNGATMTLFGYPVNLVEEDRIKSISTAVAGTDYIMVLGQFNKYAINSNGDLGVIRYRDNDLNQDVTKALEFLDGKVLDANAFLKIKLGA